jgi:hypothetical protein
MCTLINKVGEETKQNWQKEWEECTKARITKEFFLKVQDRQKLKNKYNPNPHSDGDRPRENQGLPPPLQNSRKKQTVSVVMEIKPQTVKKNLDKQRCAEGFNSGVKWLITVSSASDGSNNGAADSVERSLETEKLSLCCWGVHRVTAGW